MADDSISDKLKQGIELKQGIDCLIGNYNSFLSELKMPYRLGLIGVDPTFYENNGACPKKPSKHQRANGIKANINFKDYREESYEIVPNGRDTRCECDYPPYAARESKMSLEARLFNSDNHAVERRLAEVLHSLELELSLSLIGEIFFKKENPESNTQRLDFMKYLLELGNKCRKVKQDIDFKDLVERKNYVNRELTGGALSGYGLSLEIYHQKGLKQLIFHALQLMTNIDFEYPSLIKK